MAGRRHHPRGGALKSANLLLAFLLELAMLAAWGWKGWNVPLPEPWPALLAVLIPLFVIAIWGLFAAPRARYPLPVAGTLALKASLLGGGALALASTGQLVWAAVDALLIAVNLVLAGFWGQFGRPRDGLGQSLGLLLRDYGRRFPQEPVTKRFQEFLASGEPLQGKTNPKRHITASAWIVNPERTKVLLTHHAKLNIWVQLGGHTDEGEDWTEAALREAREESGLSDLRLAQPGLFDLDIHEIPARSIGTPQEVPAHDHYDLRFLVEADDSGPLVVSDESHALAWVELGRLEEYTREPSQLRMRRKS